MNERHPETTELDEATENQIEYMMNTRGLSRADAKLLVVVDEQQKRLVTTREDLPRYRPPIVPKRPNRIGRGRPPVGEDSEDVMTGTISDEQLAINTRGIRLAREALRASTPPLTPQERAIARARQERRNRNY